MIKKRSRFSLIEKGHFVLGEPKQLVPFNIKTYFVGSPTEIQKYKCVGDQQQCKKK